MNTLTHEQISRRAEKIWRDRGCPSGCDSEIWNEAENQLKSESASSATLSEGQSDHALAEKSSSLKKAARAPKSPSKTAPKPAPAETGKPLWRKPHSR